MIVKILKPIAIAGRHVEAGTEVDVSLVAARQLLMSGKGQATNQADFDRIYPKNSAPAGAITVPLNPYTN